MAKQKGAKPYLVLVDFSPDSKKALATATGLARATGAPLLIVHVVNDPGHAPGYYADVGKRKKYVHRIEDAAERMMHEFMAEAVEANDGLGTDVEFRSRLVTGLPVHRALEVEAAEKPQMIVMGSRGRTGLDRMLLGSKAEQIVRLARSPVLVVKG